MVCKRVDCLNHDHVQAHRRAIHNYFLLFQGHGVGRFGFLSSFSSWLINGCLLTASSEISSWRVYVCLHCFHIVSISYKIISYIGVGPTHMTSFYVNYLFKDPFSKYSHIWRCWGEGCNIWIWGEGHKLADNKLAGYISFKGILSTNSLYFSNAK